MPWNSSTSGPSGVVISMTLATALSDRGSGRHTLIDSVADVSRLRRAYDQAGDRKRGFEAQLRAPDRRMQAGLGEEPLDVLGPVRVPAVRLQGIGSGVAGLRQIGRASCRERV